MCLRTQPCVGAVRTDLNWWLDYVFNRLSRVSPATRALVLILDARNFSKDNFHFSSDNSAKTLEQSFKLALELLPSVGSVLLDGHTDLDPRFLIELPQQQLLLLSLRDCATPLSHRLFSSPSLQSLIYLDVSGVPGSILPLAQAAILPNLQVLKIRHREVDNAALTALVNRFGLGLWSLDLAVNKITDDIIETLRARCFPSAQLRTDAHFQVEGKLYNSPHGTPENGPFMTILESPWSETFTHPERYFVDSPMYTARPDGGLQEYETLRSNGRTQERRDSADAVGFLLSTCDHGSESSRGLTHLHLSNNQISAFGIEKLFRISNGQLQEFTCDRMQLLSNPDICHYLWPRSAKLYGILGMSHIFRPVISSNIHTLRIHHSFVTNIPELQMDGLPLIARTYLAETSIHSRIEMAYPQAFIPDMNPRLKSLTLTCIPRRSSGPLITKLTNFLRLLALQERGLYDTGLLTTPSWRGPGMLRGIKHVRLEFEPDPMNEQFSTEEEVDAEKLMSSGDCGFSFFDDERAALAPSKPAHILNPDMVNSSANAYNVQFAEGLGRNEGDFLSYQGQWNSEAFSIQVWVGPHAEGANAFLKEYRRLVIELNIRSNVGPVTPCQILAGAPRNSYVFQTAWCIAIMPRELRVPTFGDLTGMEDTVEALRAYRLTGRAMLAKLKESAGHARVPPGRPHYFWGGRLEVSTENAKPRSQPSQHWR